MIAPTLYNRPRICVVSEMLVRLPLLPYIMVKSGMSLGEREGAALANTEARSRRYLTQDEITPVFFTF